MKKYNKILILLIAICLILFFINQKFKEPFNIDKKQEVTTEDVLNKIDSEINIYVYNDKKDELENLTVNLEDHKDIDININDYINEVIKNTTYLEPNMKFLVAYNITENNHNILLVKVSREFNKFENTNKLKGFAKSLSQTILKNFSDIDEVYLQIDTN